MAPLLGAAGQKVGKIVLQTSVGATIIAGISHLLGSKRETEIIESRGFTEMRLEKNNNLLEINLVGASGVIIIATIAIVCICLCGKMKKVLTKCKEEKIKKKEEKMEMKKKEKVREEEMEEEVEEKEEEEEEVLKMEDI